MNTKRITLVLASLLYGAAASPSLAITYTTLDFPGATGPAPYFGTYALGISGNNIVGDYVIGSVDRGFLYNGTTYTTLDFPGSILTEAFGISGGNIVGIYEAVNHGGDYYHGFLYNGTTYTTLDPLGFIGSNASGISGSNIVGSYFDATGVSHGFVYNGSTYTTLDDPLGTRANDARGIDGNNIVGDYYDASNRYHGSLYNGTTYTTLDDPSGLSTIARAISGGNVVGTAGSHGFLYDGTTWTTLDDPLGTQETFASGISGNNIVGFYEDAAGSIHGFLATVPEPATFVLAAIGFFGVVTWRWRGVLACLLVAAATLAVPEARADVAYAWGDNVYGQLGDGTTTNRSTPAPVTGLTSGVTAVAAGGNTAWPY